MFQHNTGVKLIILNDASFVHIFYFFVPLSKYIHMLVIHYNCTLLLIDKYLNYEIITFLPLVEEYTHTYLLLQSG